ncbi:MAG: class I SAM-dependent methyltransferase [Bacillota bacterium]
MEKERKGQQGKKRTAPRPGRSKPRRKMADSVAGQKRTHGRKGAAPGRPATGQKRLPDQTHWGNVADWYDGLAGDKGSEYHQRVVIPGVLRLLGLTGRGAAARAGEMRVLDLACGQGVLCRRLAAEGCQVTGIDAATALIEAARRRNEEDRLPIDYLVADVTELVEEGGRLTGPLRPESYDAVTIILSIQNITPLSPVWQAARALLKPGGALVLVMMHPCFRVPKQSGWHWDETTGSQLRVVGQYLTSDQMEIVIHPGLAAHGKDDRSTTHFHRPLQAYVNTLGNAGLYLDHIEEWASHKTDQPGPKKEAIDRARKEIPLFLGMRARKV